LGHFDAVKSETAQEKGVLGQKHKWDKEQLSRDFGAWGYALVISFLPFIMVFVFFTGPNACFTFWELFRDYALFYVCVTMSALSLYTYDKMEKWIKVLHILVLVLGMVVYFLTTNGVSIPLFNIIDYRKFIFFFFAFSTVLGCGTILYSSVRKGA